MQRSKAEQDRLKSQAQAYATIMRSKASTTKPEINSFSAPSKQAVDFIEPEGEIDYSKYVRK